MKIMIVDDEQDVESLFMQRFRKDLKSNQFEFHFAFSAESATQYLSSLNPIDIVLILSDINMPGKSGLDLLKEVKSKFPQLKVMMVTAYGDQQNYDKAFSLGADDFITKPIDFEQLREKIVSLGGT
ncbi:MAG TPA: response regulator [Bacteroidia bacterium]|nr:response regulator [Bacteroidia bacterium]